MLWHLLLLYHTAMISIWVNLQLQYNNRKSTYIMLICLGAPALTLVSALPKRCCWSHARARSACAESVLMLSNIHPYAFLANKKMMMQVEESLVSLDTAQLVEHVALAKAQLASSIPRSVAPTLMCPTLPCHSPLKLA